MSSLIVRETKVVVRLPPHRGDLQSGLDNQLRAERRLPLSARSGLCEHHETIY